MSSRRSSLWNLLLNLAMYIQAILCHLFIYVLLNNTTFLISSGYCRSINQPHHLPHHNQLQAVCRCQRVTHSNVEKVGMSIQNYVQKEIYITMQYYKQNCMCTSCMFDSSHCPDSCTPYHCANFSAKRRLPVFFTACTTVFQVRGKSPVPLSLASHFSTSCNIRSPTFELLVAMLSMKSGSMCRYVPNSLHRASKSWLRALITSARWVHSDTALQ